MKTVDEYLAESKKLIEKAERISKYDPELAGRLALKQLRNHISLLKRVT